MNVPSDSTFPKATRLLQTVSFALILVALTIIPSAIHSQGLIVKPDSSKVTQPSKNQPIANRLVLQLMTTEQIDTINHPDEGMVIYNTTVKKPQYYDGTAWKNFDMHPHTIGEEFAGGIIFYLDSSGNHGMVVTLTDQHTSAQWGRGDEKNPFGANGKAIGAGKINTQKITKSITLSGAAARLCTDFKTNGYADWFLPSLEELNLIYKNLKNKSLGNFANAEYWSSSETDFNNAWLVDFSTGIPIEHNVSKHCYVRAVRSF